MHVCYGTTCGGQTWGSHVCVSICRSTPVVRLGSRLLYLISYLTSPQTPFKSCWFLNNSYFSLAWDWSSVDFINFLDFWGAGSGLRKQRCLRKGMLGCWDWHVEYILQFLAEVVAGPGWSCSLREVGEKSLSWACRAVWSGEWPAWCWKCQWFRTTSLSPLSPNAWLQWWQRNIHSFAINRNYWVVLGILP